MTGYEKTITVRVGEFKKDQLIKLYMVNTRENFKILLSIRDALDTKYFSCDAIGSVGSMAAELIIEVSPVLPESFDAIHEIIRVSDYTIHKIIRAPGYYPANSTFYGDDNITVVLYPNGDAE